MKVENRLVVARDEESREMSRMIGVTIEVLYVRDLSRDGIVLILIVVRFQKSTHVMRWHRTIYANGTNANFLILMSYCSYEGITIEETS